MLYCRYQKGMALVSCHFFYKPAANIKKHINHRKDISMNKQMTIGDIKGLTFVGGQITSRIEANPKKDELSRGKVMVIPPKAIQNGEIAHAELYELEYKTEIDEKKLTQAGDIVVKLSTPYDVAYITEEDAGLLITSFCIIIRNRGKEVSSEFLTAFMNSGVYRRQVLSKVSGATVPMLTMGKIKEVRIKVLDVDKQEQVAEYYKIVSEKEKVLTQIIELEKEKIDAVLGGK